MQIAVLKSTEYYVVFSEFIASVPETREPSSRMHWPLSGLGGEPFAKRQVQRKHVRTMDGLLDTRALARWPRLSSVPQRLGRGRTANDQRENVGVN